MKSNKGIFSCLLFVLLTFCVQGQTMLNGSTCGGAIPVCGLNNGLNSINYRESSTSNCFNGTVKQFFQFIPISSGSVSGALAYTLTYTGTSSTPSTAYKVYGPFESQNGVCELIQNFQAPVAGMGANSTGANQPINVTVTANKFYILEITSFNCAGTIGLTVSKEAFNCAVPELPCSSCIQKFQPMNGKFVLSAWVKENVSSGAVSYMNAKIKLTTDLGTTTISPSGQIIDGWQRIEYIFTAGSVGQIQLELLTLSGEAYFDDIRIFPFDGSMMSYVYDPQTFRLMAELDERNYAKIYEYDEEGKLIRVKKETEKGIMTIQENRENNAIRP